MDSWLFIGEKTRGKNTLWSPYIVKERKKPPTKICFFLPMMIFSSWIRFLIKAVSDYKKTNKPWFLWVHIVLHLCRGGRKAFDQSKSKIKLKVNHKLEKGKWLWVRSFFQLRSEGGGGRCWVQWVDYKLLPFSDILCFRYWSDYSAGGESRP